MTNDLSIRLRLVSHDDIHVVWEIENQTYEKNQESLPLEDLNKVVENFKNEKMKYYFIEHNRETIGVILLSLDTDIHYHIDRVHIIKKGHYKEILKHLESTFPDIKEWSLHTVCKNSQDYIRYNNFFKELDYHLINSLLLNKQTKNIEWPKNKTMFNMQFIKKIER